MIVPAVNEVAVLASALALLSHGGLAAYLVLSKRWQAADRRSNLGFLGALLVTTAWAGLGLAEALWPRDGLAQAQAALDLLRYGLWFAFLLGLFGTQRTGSSATGLLRRGAALCCLLAAALLAWRFVGVPGTAPSRPETLLGLALPIMGLLLVEQLVRNVGEASRWNAKPIGLGLCCVFAFDIYLHSQGLLFGTIDSAAHDGRAGVHSLAVPFLWVAARRGSNWMARLQVSRAAAFYSATLILSGAYLLLMSAVGYYVRYLGGTWGRPLQLGLLVAGLALMGTLVFSGSLRSWLRVFVGKHFYRYRYDYREQWLGFTAILSSKRSPQEMGERIVRGLAEMVECRAGSLWTRSEAEFRPAAAWNMTPAAAAEAADGSLCRFLQQQGWVVDLDEFRATPGRYPSLALPTWLLGTSDAWLVVPLLAGEDLLGFVVLVRPLTAIQLNWEVLDLLKTAGRQAAGYLAQMQATEALLEARKFEAFNRMSAFVVHDLKNIVTQLSLMLKNAERLHDNREFQQDMLLTVESSLEKMRRLMLQLREGATPPGGARGVELTPLLARLQALAQSQGRQLELRAPERLSTRGHDDRLERVLGHLVQNALDATPATGRVWVAVARRSGQVQVEIGDEGAGMSEEFVRARLFRPFSSTKQHGMGIGSYESQQYIRELGGSLSVSSVIGKGTVLTILLPAFEARIESDLMRPAAP
jgi:putative PEP-CTERM system histidine kinase